MRASELCKSERSGRRGSSTLGGAVADITRSVSRFTLGKKKKKKPDRYEDPSGPVGPVASLSGVTVVKDGILTPRDDTHQGGRGTEGRGTTDDDDSRRSSLMEWLKDVLPPHLRENSRKTLSREASDEASAGSPCKRQSRLSRLSAWGTGSMRKLPSARPPPETMSAAEMMSEAHREEMIRQQRAKVAEERSGRRGSLMRMGSSLMSMAKRSSSPKRKHYPAAQKTFDDTSDSTRDVNATL